MTTNQICSQNLAQSTDQEKKIIFLLENNSDSVISIANEWVRLNETNDSIQSRAYYYKGRAFYKKHLYDSSLYCYLQGESFGEKVNDNDIVAECCSRLSWVYLRKEDYKNGIEKAIKAIKLFESQDNNIGLSRTYTNMAANYSMLKDVEDAKKIALKYQKESLNYALRTSDSTFMMIVYNNLAAMYRANNLPDSALFYLNHCFNFKGVKGYDETIVRVYSNLSLLYHEYFNDPEKGRKYDHLTYDYYKEKNDKFQQALIATNLGRHYQNANEYDSALKYFNEAIRLSTEMKLSANLRTTYLSLSKLFVKMNDYENAYRIYLQYHKAYDVDDWNERNKEIDKLKTEFETERKEKEIELLTQKSEIQALKINQRTKQRNILIIIAIFIVILTFVLVLVIQERQKTALALAEKNETLAKQKIDKLIIEQDRSNMQALVEGQEKERQRIAQDLHDQLGAMLSAVKLNFSAMESRIESNGNGLLSQYQKATEMLDLAVGEVRRISHNMSSGILSRFGLHKALENLKETMERSAKIHVDLMLFDVNNSLDNQLELQIYRIIQELFANILKHARASEVIVQLVKSDSELMLTVEDDGVGFNPEAKKGGIGMMNITSRVTSLGGTAYFDSGLGAGTTVSITIPLIQNEENEKVEVADSHNV